jgi:HK97 family phage major capsid protein
MSAFSRKLREKRATLANQANQLLAKAETENRELSAEEVVSFDKIHGEIDELGKQVERAERQDTLNTELATSTGTRAGRADSDRRDPSADERKEEVEKENRAFTNFLRYGEQGMVAEDRAILAEKRAQSVGVNAGGGYTVAPAFYNHLEEAQKAFGGMLDAATVITTETGATLPMPTENDVANTGAILAENAQATNQDDAFGVVNIGAFMYTSKVVLVSLQLLQDSAFDIGSFIAKKLGLRISRIWNTHFTVGTGAGAQPNGIVPASASGKVGLVGQTLSVIYDDLVDLIHSVDPAHRNNAKFMMHDSSLKVIKKLKDSQGRPLWLPGLAVKEPDTINGYPYVINQDVAVMAANAKSILFGALDKYFVRKVREISVLALRERYADFGQVGFIGFARADGNLLDAGSNPVKYYQNSAT